MFRWTIAMALAVWFVAIITSLLVTSPSTGNAKLRADAVGQALHQQASRKRVTDILHVEGKPLIGFAINLHYNDDRDRYLDAIDDLADLGCNAVLFATPAFATNGASSEIRLEVGPGRGPYRERLIELIRRARQKGMTTVLMPTVLFTKPRGGEWRGKIVPDSWDDWWQSYQRMTDHFVSIANEAQVDVYVVGSELLTTETQGQRWRKVIQRVREQFAGAITYSGNFDSYDQPTFWDELDLVAMNAYFSLRGDHADEHPPLAHVVNQWRLRREELLAFATGKGKPLLFTEVGYPSAPWGLDQPWDYLPYKDTVADHAVQRDGYDAFFSAWLPDLKQFDRADLTEKDGAPLAGVFFYEWDPYRTGDPKDTYYGIRGKPTYDLVKDRFRQINGR